MSNACKDLGRCVVSYYLTNIVLIICENFYLYNFSKILKNRILYYISNKIKIYCSKSGDSISLIISW